LGEATALHDDGKVKAPGDDLEQVRFKWSDSAHPGLVYFCCRDIFPSYSLEQSLVWARCVTPLPRAAIKKNVLPVFVQINWKCRRSFPLKIIPRPFPGLTGGDPKPTVGRPTPRRCITAAVIICAMTVVIGEQWYFAKRFDGAHK
jgi:hypothetical protein